MRTLVMPSPAQVPPPPMPFLPPAVFAPFRAACVNRDCNAGLLADDPDDVRYGYRYTMYGDDLVFRLYVVCPHCDTVRVLEEYAGAPGNPTGMTPRPDWDERVAHATRSAAYRRWADTVDAVGWDWVFWQTDVRSWSSVHPRESRKMQARVRPGAVPILTTRFDDTRSDGTRGWYGQADTVRSLRRGLPADLAATITDTIRNAGSEPGAARQTLAAVPEIEQNWTGTPQGLAQVRAFVRSHFG